MYQLTSHKLPYDAQVLICCTFLSSAPYPHTQSVNPHQQGYCSLEADELWYCGIVRDRLICLMVIPGTIVCGTKWCHKYGAVDGSIMTMR